MYTYTHVRAYTHAHMVLVTKWFNPSCDISHSSYSPVGFLESWRIFAGCAAMVGGFRLTTITGLAPKVVIHLDRRGTCARDADSLSIYIVGGLCEAKVKPSGCVARYKTAGQVRVRSICYRYNVTSTRKYRSLFSFCLVGHFLFARNRRASFHPVPRHATYECFQ